AALILLVEIGLAPGWVVIIIISREFAVTGLRLVAAGDGVVLAASKMGKIKTVSQIVAIAALLLHIFPFSYIVFPFATIMLCVEFAASNMGNIITLSQIVAIAALLLHNFPFSYIGFPFATIMLYVALIFTVLSGYDYFAKNWHVMRDVK